MQSIVAEIDASRVLGHLVALATAYLLALPTGWDREMQACRAGLRTVPLAAIATCGAVLATERLLQDEPQGTARIVEGLMTGLGAAVART